MPFLKFYWDVKCNHPIIDQFISDKLAITAVIWYFLIKCFSKDKIIFEIKQILDAQPPEAKKLSDQKLSDMLAERGIKVARRTIAKYRSQIGVKSSYDR